ncbi:MULTISPECIES: HupE/UreJ family protein [unclassified Rhizobacter]|uniref:HupE/UreJ family protein n=1 Tax=unclassified Rhizobacter TaxID=2640088 RepID=UPI00070215D2|nr:MULTISPECIES: HupE/UreJ family protein [unclassified Rhizobacter]KQU74899.1 urease accessory protein UreJ [Rhizobacter sp. Root29]KQW01026.1 urease accessory protein UreJ [Rhizobacter sp. Root1238]KRB03876.1 urease accessory protein UreJ [Rhizobacter sp. Root16D2]
MTTPSRSTAWRAAAVALSLGLPALAFAHTGADAGRHHDAIGALAAGFSHPFSGLDHLAAMVAVGLWSALGSRRVWLAPLAFGGTLLAGALIGLAGLMLPAVEPMIAASLLVLGLLVATNARLPAAAGAALAAVFALFHGLAHGAELAGPTAAFALTGMVAATALLHGAGIGLGLLLRSRSAWLPRVAGSAVALFGIALLVN